MVKSGYFLEADQRLEGPKIYAIVKSLLTLFFYTMHIFLWEREKLILWNLLDGPWLKKKKLSHFIMKMAKFK